MSSDSDDQEMMELAGASGLIDTSGRGDENDGTFEGTQSQLRRNGRNDREDQNPSVGGTRRSGRPSSNGSSSILTIPNNITLEDVGGLKENLRYLKRAVIFPMANKATVSRWGVTVPKGIMFYGAPGTGKTLVAKAIANELDKAMGPKTKVSFIHRKGADCLGKFFGESEKNLRNIFKEAEDKKPAVLFFDELDGLCPNRESGSKSCEVYCGVVTTFLGLVDSVKSGEILVIGATNRLEAVDPAVRRPGRFDKELVFHPPDDEGRNKILQLHTRKWKKGNQPSDATLKEVVSKTRGLSGAYLENVCKEALQAAIQRAGADGESTVSLSSVKVILRDWNAALNQLIIIESPNAKTQYFGSSLITVQKKTLIQPLLSGLLDRLKSRVMDAFAIKPDGAVSSDFKLKSFLIWNNVLSSDKDIEKYLVPSLLSEPEFQKFPIYEINQGNCSMTIAATIQQAFKSTQPCILYLPRINLLYKAFEEFENAQNENSGSSWLLSKLNLTRGHPILVLASATIPEYNLPKELRELFPHKFKMRNPNDEERAAFFATLPGHGVRWNKLKEDCAIFTEERKVDFLVNVYRNISLVSKIEKNSLAAAEEIVNMLPSGGGL